MYSKEVKEYMKKARWELLPTHLHEGLMLYLEKGIRPGSFLQAVINNDLNQAVHFADETNLKRLRDIMNFFHWDVPLICWGNREKMERWITDKELEKEYENHSKLTKVEDEMIAGLVESVTGG